MTRVDLWLLAIFASAAPLACEEQCPQLDELHDCAGDCGPRGSLLWERSHQGGGSGNPTALAVDACGSIIGAGTVAPDRTVGTDAMWVAKYRADGAREWTHVSNRGLGDRGSAIATDPDGAVFVGGTTTVERANFSDSESRPLLRAYDADGEERWTRILQHSDAGTIRAIAVDADGGVLAAGGGGWVLRMHVLGGVAWEKQLDAFTTIRDIAVDEDQRFAVIGGSEEDHREAWVGVFDLDGEELWRYGLDASPQGVAFDSSGEVVVGAGSLTSMTLLRLGAGGDLVDQREIALLFDRTIHFDSMTLDPGGRVVLGGTVDVDMGGYAAWAAKLSTNGSVRWEWSLDHHGGSSWGRSIAVDQNGAVFVGARVDVSVYGGGIDNDIWLGRIAP